MKEASPDALHPPLVSSSPGSVGLRAPSSEVLGCAREGMVKTYGAEALGLNAEEFNALRPGMTLLRWSTQILEARHLEGGEVALWKQEGGLYIHHRRNCGQLIPYDAATAIALGRVEEPATYGEKSPPLTLEQARKLPSGAKTVSRFGTIYTFVGIDPRMPHEAMVILSDDDTLGWDHIAAQHPADEACARACDRIPSEPETVEGERSNKAVLTSLLVNAKFDVRHRDVRPGRALEKLDEAIRMVEVLL